MKIIYIHQYFRTPGEGGAIRSWYIATGMIRAGHTVEMITAHNNKGYLHCMIDGISVHYLPVKYENRFGYLRRIFTFLLFAYKAYFLSKKFADIDLAYITSTPLTVGLTALKLKKKYNIPYLFEVRDLWPEAPIKMGVIRNPVLKNLSRRLEKKIYSEADKIVALSPGIKSHVNRLYPDKPVLICPNMSDCSFFNLTKIRDAEIERRYKLTNNFVISYFGAIGWANALHYFLDIAAVCKKNKLNIRFFIIGSGSRRIMLENSALSRNLDNLYFVDHLNKHELKKYLSVTDAAFISFASYPILEHNSPNKFFDALASGKIIISNVNGWITDLITHYYCGFYEDPARPKKFVDLIKPFLEDNNKLHEYKLNARKLAESNFNKEYLISELLNFIETQ